jgi:aminotransferase
MFSNTLGKEELEAVDRVFQSRWIGPGKENSLFEKELGEKVGTDKVLSLSSCTAGLFMSMKVLGIGRGDEVIIPTVHFIGAVNAIVECGAVPVFADVDSCTLNVLPSEIKRLRTNKTKAVFLLHYGGHPCNMGAIYAESKGLHLIEDGANSPFSKYKGTNCGLLGDIGIYSFDAMKILCVGGGGAMVFKSEEYYNRAKEYRYFGLKNKKQTGIDSFKENKDRWWEIELACTSNKSTQTDILSAVARVQLRKVDDFIRRRKVIWGEYQGGLRNLDWLSIPPEPLLDTTSSYYMYWVNAGKYRDTLARHLVDNGIYCTFRYYPLHLIKYFNSNTSLPNAELINETVLNIPLHQNLTSDDVGKIIDTIRRFKC